MAQKIALLDGYSLMYRAYHALQTPMTAPDGTPTNAVHGFVMMLLKVIEEERPDSLAVAFDMHAPTFRHDMFDGYKAQRKPMPEELAAQMPLVKQALDGLGIRRFIAVLECRVDRDRDHARRRGGDGRRAAGPVQGFLRRCRLRW